MTWQEETERQVGEFGPLILGVDHLGYLARQLRRRGFSHPARLAEGLDVAQQVLALDVLSSAEMPDDWRELRAVLDRAVYVATCELRQRVPSLSEYEESLGHRSAGTPWEEADDPRGAQLRERIERLPVGTRLLVKLKLADVFFPGLAAGGPVGWESDESEYLRLRHDDRPLAIVEEQLRERLLHDSDRRRGKIPSTVIAWLLGRASPGAVDSAYREIKIQLRRSISPIDAASISLTPRSLTASSINFRQPGGWACTVYPFGLGMAA